MIDPRVLGTAFQARHLAVPIEQAYGVNPTDAADIAAASLRNKEFDQAPVMEDGLPIGFVLTRDLEARGATSVRDVMSPIRSGNIVSADAPVGDLLDWIVRPGLLFVVDGRRVVGFISVSDFNKQPMRGYLYLQVASLETNLAELVRRVFVGRQDAILQTLNAAGRQQVRHRQESDRAAQLDTDLVAYLDFGHLLSVSRSDERLAGAVEGMAAADDEHFDAQLRDLRNRVMHPTRGLIADKGGLIALRDLENALDRLSKQVAQVLRAAIEAG